MLKHLLLTALAAAVTVTMGYAADPTVLKVNIPVEKTSPISGRQMFTSYCAPCHGVDGRGHGPAAAALTTMPTDLTVLSRRNHGAFPDVHIVTVLQFGAEGSAHGTPQMPVWGPILAQMNRTNTQDKQLRISNLSRYIETMQQR